MSELPAPRDGAVLFDLDGTFADTAPDMAAALNRLLDRHGRAPLPFARVRPYVSHGGRGMLRIGFDLGPNDQDYEPLRLEFMEIYAAALVKDTVLFPGIVELIDTLERRGISWGIVTNKPGWLTDPLMELLGLRERAGCVVSGDTAARPKPYPDPLFHACDLLRVDPRRCWYVGDAERDIQAGLAAGMGTLVALFGYLGTDDAPDRWGAHGLIEHPLDVLDWLPGT
ncbi:phosphoglycolate phosphatase [Thiocystis minor]|uniref:HAD family hydrolase n=1 Tax=Thiocystis minor TaxID=61597 RepID=UPI001914438C|nr:HAD-IA family hydrolase [Thiocystis minor]MBK5963541.1 phosphoglycolate phosphatase [Thiocystis minor]